jgi:hypothetical protein
MLTTIVEIYSKGILSAIRARRPYEAISTPYRAQMKERI